MQRNVTVHFFMRHSVHTYILTAGTENPIPRLSTVGVAMQCIDAYRTNGHSWLSGQFSIAAPDLRVSPT